MKKFAISLDPVQVARLRDLARKTAVKEGRDLTWVSLLREAMSRFLTSKDGGKETVFVGGTK